MHWMIVIDKVGLPDLWDDVQLYSRIRTVNKTEMRMAKM